VTGRENQRVHDIIQAATEIVRLADDKTFAEVSLDPILRAAFERFLEIISEASRHLPQQLKESTPEIQWVDIAAIGNHLRHANHRVEFEVLWRIYEDGELAELSAACELYLDGNR
jgi:uncharacterized protein with HEPN domain